ncbi:hypothetical protein L1887_35591 [Cichorium endivia]|nr:hypothetical protein L1887_35591 [Cichorium endivia]
MDRKEWNQLNLCSSYLATSAEFDLNIRIKMEKISNQISDFVCVWARVLQNYPSKLNFTALQCLLSCMQSFLVAIALERDAYKWKLGWDIRILAIAYCGFVVTGFTFYLQTWVIEKKGPVFLAMSTPLAFVFTSITAALLIGEVISLGSVIGGILLIGGLYFVLWGKSNEEMLLKNKGCLPQPEVLA